MLLNKLQIMVRPSYNKCSWFNSIFSLENHANIETDAQEDPVSNHVIYIDASVLGQEEFQVYYEASANNVASDLQYVDEIAPPPFSPLSPPMSPILQEIIDMPESYPQQLVEEYRVMELPSLEPEQLEESFLNLNI
jgi:hypothetical protein